MRSSVSACDEQSARVLRERHLATYGGPEVPVQVESIAEDLCGLMVEEHRSLGLSGALIPSECRIVLNADEAASRRRFTLAHELGHWECHVKTSEALPLYCRAEDVSGDTDRALEREANTFAADLLMPEALVQTLWADTWDIRLCARQLGVSPSAMQYRLFEFGLIAEGPRR
jgi:IrrE N-terminal-like domain